jgi:hypothetical protein
MINKERVKLLVDALRSDEYEQAPGFERIADGFEHTYLKD